MDSFKANPKVNVDTILRYISQEEIMERYLGVSVKTRGMFCSPLRSDKNPTCNFCWIDGKLLFRDWATEDPLDCFGVVMEKYNVNYYKAQEVVAKDFDLIQNIKSGNLEKRNIEVDFSSRSAKSKSKISVKIQSFTEENIEYLQSYYITSQICKKFNIYTPKYARVNGRAVYKYSSDNPALAYYFGIDEQNSQKWKIYFYKKETGNRFLCNTNRINGWVQIPEIGDNLIITKSLKDVACLDIFDIPSIAMQAESQTPYDYIIEEMKERFNNVISLFDYDDAGIKRAEVLQERFDIPYYFIQDQHAKDFSDYIQIYGKQKARLLTQEILCS